MTTLSRAHRSRDQASDQVSLRAREIAISPVVAISISPKDCTSRSNALDRSARYAAPRAASACWIQDVCSSFGRRDAI